MKIYITYKFQYLYDVLFFTVWGKWGGHERRG